MFTWLVGTAVASLAFGMLPGLHLILWIHVLADIALGAFVGYLIRSRNIGGYAAPMARAVAAAPPARSFAGGPPAAVRPAEPAYAAEPRRPLSYQPFQPAYEPPALRGPVIASGNGASAYARRSDFSSAAVVVRPSSKVVLKADDKVKLTLDDGMSFRPGTISGRSGAVAPREVVVVRRGKTETPAARAGTLDFFTPDEDEALAVTGG
ncbi:MAG: hypothetical protein ACRDIA_01720 [Actinomycetota bacterium]